MSEAPDLHVVPDPAEDLDGRVVVIGVAGGTASGKTTLVDEIIRYAGPHRVAVLRQDSYYRDQTELPEEERALTNYDHPDAIDSQLLIQHLEALLEKRPIEAPTYDFRSHNRAPQTETIQPKKVVIVEGILVFCYQPLVELMDLKLFVDTDHDLRLLRRLRRDVEERGRTFESVTRRYLEHVRPMHLQFVEPSKAHADLVVPHGGMNKVVVGLLSSLIEMRELDRRRTPRGPSSLF